MTFLRSTSQAKRRVKNTSRLKHSTSNRTARILSIIPEFISVEGLTRQNPKAKRQMRFDEEERPFAVQIFGGKADRMAMGAEMAQEVGADILDVNCGCPAPKVVKNGGGSGLLRDLPLL